MITLKLTEDEFHFVFYHLHIATDFMDGDFPKLSIEELKTLSFKMGMEAIQATVDKFNVAHRSFCQIGNHAGNNFQDTIQ